MEKLLVEKNIKEVLEKIQNEIGNDKEVHCEWRASHADISVIDKENSYIYFEARIYDDGLYYLGETENNFKDILDFYFIDSKNLINYNEFKDLLKMDKDFSYFKIYDEELDYYSSLEREFASRLEKDSTELLIHKGIITHSLHKDPKENEWNLTTLVENKPSSDIRGDYQECFDDLLSQIKYTDLFIELARQDKMFNLNNYNEKGEKEGLWIIPKEDTWIKEDIVYYENGKLNEKYAEIFKNNEIHEIGTYQNDVKNGNAYSYDKDTLNLIEEKTYDNGILNGKYKSFLYTGELSCEGNIKNGEFDGSFKNYHTDDIGNLYLWQTCNYVNGKEEGEVINYYPNGSIKAKFNMVNNNIEGKLFEFYENGNIKEKSDYEKNKLNGVSIKYYESGNLKEILHINDDIPSKKTEYYSNGSKDKETEYNKGIVEQECFYNKGQLERVKNYEFGNLKEEKTYDENFNKTMFFTYKDDKTVNWKGYYPNGNLKFDNNLKDNLFIGSSKIYYENGNLKESSNYIIKDNQALKDGEYKLFSENGSLLENLKYKEGIVMENLLEKKNNLWEKSNDLNKNNAWENKVNSDKDNQWER